MNFNQQNAASPGINLPGMLTVGSTDIPSGGTRTVTLLTAAKLKAIARNSALEVSILSDITTSAGDGPEMLGFYFESSSQSWSWSYYVATATSVTGGTRYGYGFTATIPRDIVNLLVAGNESLAGTWTMTAPFGTTMDVSYQFKVLNQALTT